MNLNMNVSSSLEEEMNINSLIHLSELETVLEVEKQERKLKLMKTNTRRSMFPGTYVVTNVKAISESQLISHKPLEIISENVNFDANKKRRKRPKNRKVIIDAEVSRRSTLSIRLFLKEFCTQFLTHCYNPLMRSIKDALLRSRSDKHDETYYLWAVRFFMEFSRVHDFRVDYVSETISFTMFHYIQTNLQTYLEMVQTNRKEAIIWSKRMHLALQAYNELLLSLKAMSSSKDSAVRESAVVIKNNVFYTMEYRDILIVLFRHFDETKQSRSYLRDLICCTHLFHKMLEHFCKGTRQFVVQKKKRKIRRRTKKPTAASLSVTEEDLEMRWNVLSEELSALVTGGATLPHDVVPFDAASSVDVDQQRVSAMCRVQRDLRRGSASEAVALLRAAREVWPEGNEFGSADISPEEELNALREIFFAPLPQDADATVNDQAEDEYEEEEIEVEEEIADIGTENVEQEFSLTEYISRFANPQVVKACTLLLTMFDKNTVETNHSIVKLLHRIVYDCQSAALLFQTSLFRIFQKLLNNPSYNIRHYQELREFARHILAKFFAVAQTNKKVFVELFFWKSQKEAFAITEGYDVMEKKSNVKQLWTEDQDDELRRLYEDCNKDDPQHDVVDQILAHLTDRTKTRRQVLRQLVMLNIIGSAKDLQKNMRRSGNKGPRQWREEEELQLRELYDQFKSTQDPVGSIIANMMVPRSKRTVVQKLLDLGVVSDKSELRKKRTKKNNKKSGGHESEDNSDPSEESDSDNDEPARNRSESSEGEVESSDDDINVALDRLRSQNSSNISPTPPPRDAAASSRHVNNSRNNKPQPLNKAKQCVAVALRKGLTRAVEWLKTRLLRTADEREEDGDDESVPLVPLTEEQFEALDDSSFKSLLKSCGLKSPSDQERFWRIPSQLSPPDLRSVAEVLSSDVSTGSQGQVEGSENHELSDRDEADPGTHQDPSSPHTDQPESLSHQPVSDRDNETDDHIDDSKSRALEQLLKKRKEMAKRAGAAASKASSDDDDVSLAPGLGGHSGVKSSDDDDDVIMSSNKKRTTSRKRATVASDDESGTEQQQQATNRKRATVASDDESGTEQQQQTTNRKRATVASDDESDTRQQQQQTTKITTTSRIESDDEEMAHTPGEGRTEEVSDENENSVKKRKRQTKPARKRCHVMESSDEEN